MLPDLVSDRIIELYRQHLWKTQKAVLKNLQVVYELFGYDRFDGEYYPIGYYASFERALEVQKAHIAYQKEHWNDDTLEMRAIDKQSDYYKANKKTIERLFDRDPDIE